MEGSATESIVDDDAAASSGATPDTVVPESAPDTTPRGLPIPALAAAYTSGDILTVDSAADPTPTDPAPTGARRVSPPRPDGALAGVAAQSHSDAGTEATDQSGKHSTGPSSRRRFRIDRSTDTNPWLSVSISGSTG